MSSISSPSNTGSAAKCLLTCSLIARTFSSLSCPLFFSCCSLNLSDFSAASSSPPCVDVVVGGTFRDVASLFSPPSPPLVVAPNPTPLDSSEVIVLVLDLLVLDAEINPSLTFARCPFLPDHFSAYSTKVLDRQSTRSRFNDAYSAANFPPCPSKTANNA